MSHIADVAAGGYWRPRLVGSSIMEPVTTPTDNHHSRRDVAILGLGRMGTAMAERLTEEGFSVLGWTRSGRTPAGLRTAPDAAAAVAESDLVLLALYDGAACRDVLEAVRPHLRTGALVINTSTVGPDEAAGYADEFGTAYLHAPVLGSTPAVRKGALQVLAGGDPGPARTVLEALGTVHVVADARTSAALKLVANSSLAGAVLALGESLHQGDALGLPREQVLDILATGQLGGLVAAKRPHLNGDALPAEFTIGALAKDMRLLADASRTPLSYPETLANAPAGPDADIARATERP